MDTKKERAKCYDFRELNILRSEGMEDLAKQTAAKEPIEGKKSRAPWWPEGHAKCSRQETAMLLGGQRSEGQALDFQLAKGTLLASLICGLQQNESKKNPGV